jgi:RecG-like helicase
MSVAPRQSEQQPTTRREQTPAEALSTPAEFVRGVGPQRAELLARLGIRTAGDLIFFFPRDYEDLTDRRDIGDLEEEHVQTVRGEVVEIDGRSSGFGKSVVGVLVKQGSDFLPASKAVAGRCRIRALPGSTVPKINPTCGCCRSTR